MAPSGNQFHVALGIELVEFHEDGAIMRLAVSRQHLNSAGVVHGGAIFTLADAALGVGISGILGKRCTTAEMKINYLRPVTGGLMTARSRIVRDGRRLVVAAAEVHCADLHIAEALATFAVLDRDGSFTP